MRLTTPRSLVYSQRAHAGAGQTILREAVGICKAVLCVALACVSALLAARVACRMAGKPVPLPGTEAWAAWLERTAGIGQDVDDLQGCVFLGLICVINFINLTIVLPVLAVTAMRRLRNNRCPRCGCASTRDSLPQSQSAICAVVPCYLPNEQEIIEESAWHILENLEAPGELDLWVVYNTPYDLPEIETKLRALAARADLPRGRKLHVLRVEHSSSKAENLNAVLPQLSSPYIAVYDADHHPDPESLMLMYDKLLQDRLDCVQGSTYIRNLQSGLLGRFIDADFFVSHFMILPAMKLLTRSAFFGGSNALWRRESLSGTSFDHNMQTEDIDLSIRALIECRRIDFCPEARSGELAPASLKALYKQRLRWAIGWDQVSFKHFRSVVWDEKLPFLRRLGLLHMLYTRWISLFLGVFASLALPMSQFLDQHSWDWGPLPVLLLANYVILAVCCMVESICQAQHRGYQSWIQVLFVALYLCLNSQILMIQIALVSISMLKILSGRVEGWAVTSRSSAKNLSAAATAEALFSTNVMNVRRCALKTSFLKV